MRDDCGLSDRTSVFTSREKRSAVSVKRQSRPAGTTHFTSWLSHARVLRIGLGPRGAGSAGGAHVRHLLAVRALGADAGAGCRPLRGRARRRGTTSGRRSRSRRRPRRRSPCVPRRYEAGIEGGERDHARQRIGAMDGGRGPAHDLDLLQEAQARGVARGVGKASHAVALREPDAVDGHLHAVAVETADVEVAEAEAGGAVLDRHARLVAEQVAHVAGDLAEGVLPVDHGHRRGHGVDRLLDAARRADDLHALELLGARRHGLARRRWLRGRGAGLARGGRIDLGHDAAHVEVQDIELAGERRVGPGDVDLLLVGRRQRHRRIERNAPHGQGAAIGDSLAHPVVVHEAVKDRLGLVAIGHFPGLGQGREAGQKALAPRQVDDPREIARAAAAVGERNAAQLAPVGGRVDHQRGAAAVRGDPVAPVGGSRLERGGPRPRAAATRAAVAERKRPASRRRPTGRCIEQLFSRRRAAYCRD